MSAADDWVPPSPPGMKPFNPRAPEGIKARMVVILKADDVVVCECEDSRLWSRVMAAMLSDLTYPIACEPQS